MIPFEEMKLIIGALAMGFFLGKLPTLTKQMKEIERLERQLRKEGK